MIEQNEILNLQEAVYIVNLFIAQADNPNPPHVVLGFSSQDEAFGKLSIKLGVKKNTLKLTRNEFGQYTNSNRKGWDKFLRRQLLTV